MDGKSDIANLTIIDLLKAYVTKVDQREQWEKYLPLVEYAYNNTIHTYIGKAPFKVVEGRPNLSLIYTPREKIFATNEYSKDCKESSQKLKEAYPLQKKKSKMLLLISTKEPLPLKKMIGYFLSLQRHT